MTYKKVFIFLFVVFLLLGVGCDNSNIDVSEHEIEKSVNQFYETYMTKDQAELRSMFDINFKGEKSDIDYVINDFYSFDYVDYEILMREIDINQNVAKVYAIGKFDMYDSLKEKSSYFVPYKFEFIKRGSDIFIIDLKRL